jgi:hypothetical protein
MPETSTLSQRYKRRLLAGGACIHVDFHADRHFDDLGGFPGHLALLVIPDAFRPHGISYFGTESSPLKFLVIQPLRYFAASQKKITFLCAEVSKQRGINGFKVAPCDLDVD